MPRHYPACRVSRRIWALVGVLAVVGSSFVASSASAQGARSSSTIHGVVTDETGGALPGVTVTLTSPALQVGQLTQVSGPDGSYRFGELPAGVFRITFELGGFNTFIRDDLRLTIGFTARVDATLKVGALEESVTVSGAAPVVDLTSSGTASTITTETLETVPRGRDLWSVVDMAPGVNREGAPDIGGSRMASRPDMATYGVVAQPKLEVEGINITTGGDPQSAVYFNYFGFEEVQFKTSGTDAEVGTPGLHMVAVLKSGGNEFHGRYQGSYQGPQLQSENLNESLRAQGLTDTEPLKYHYDVAADLGGRIIRDKLWFYGGYNTQNRRSSLLGFVSGPGPDGRYLTGDEPLADYDNTLYGYNVKLSYQVSRNNRLIGLYQKGTKTQPQNGAGRFRPLEATRDYYDPTWVKKGEWQSTLSERMLINVVGGYGGYFADYSTPRAGFANANTPSRLDRATGLRTGGHEASDQRPRDNWQTDGSFSFFPAGSFAGRHELKVGGTMYRQLHGTGLLNHEHGNYVLVYDTVGGVPNQPVEIQINSYPVAPRNRVNTFAWYFKDTWRMSNRITLNLGLRYERQRPFIPAQAKEASPQFPQLFPAGDFPEVDLLTWNRFLPRAGVSWSLNDKTVVKVSAGTYNYLFNDADVGLYNLNALRTATFRWSDPDRNGNYTPGEVDLDVNNGRDFISISSPANRRFNSDLVQPKTTELTTSFERELMANLGLRAGYVFRLRQDYYEAPGPNELRPRSAYNIPINRRDPGPDDRVGTGDDGPMLTLYDYDPAFRGAAFVRNVIVNSPNDDRIHTFELALSKRMSKRWSAQGSFWGVKNNRWIEMMFESPNSDFFPKDETWDWGGNVSGTYMLPGDVTVAGFIQTKSGVKGAREVIFRAADPLGGTPLRQLTNIRIRTEEWGSQRAPAMTNVNIRGTKEFRLPRDQKVGIDIDVFNVLNAATPSSVNWLAGTTFGYATQVLPARVIRVGGHYNF